MGKNSMKTLMGWVMAVGLVLGQAVLGADPAAGSFFTSGVVAGTNAFWLPAATSTTTLVTNLPTGVAPAVEVGGAGVLSIGGRVVNVSAGGNTNNGGVYLNFAVSVMGDAYTTASNGFQVYLPTTGTAERVSVSNVPAGTLGSVAWVRLASVACTNIGGCWLSNIVYRFYR